MDERLSEKRVESCGHLMQRELHCNLPKGHAGDPAELTAGHEYSSRRDQHNPLAGATGEWISVKQEEPPYGVPVFVVWNGIVQDMAYSRDIGEWIPVHDCGDSAPDGTFSHWMYKPAPPNGGTE